MSTNTRIRHITFTQNLKDFEGVMNDLEKAKQYYTTFFETKKTLFDYLIISLEQGDEGTIHIQGYAYKKKRYYFTQLQDILPKTHIEQSKGTPQQNKDYINKVGTHEDKAHTNLLEPLEYGTLPQSEQGKRNDLEDLVGMITDGATDMEILAQFPSLYLRFQSHIKQLRQNILFDKYKKVQRNVTVTYIYGTTGTGKTRSIYDNFDAGDIYRVSNYGTGAFDNYEGQPILVLDEFRGGFKFSELLNYLDRYPTMLSARYSDKVACYDTVYIISNIALDEQYYNIQNDEPQSWQALLRRINKVINFDNPIDVLYYDNVLKARGLDIVELATQYFGSDIIKVIN